MKNGTKNYSITDISTSEAKLVVSSSRGITADSAQSLFLISLIVNSGMGMLNSSLNAKRLTTGETSVYTPATTKKSAYTITTNTPKTGYYDAYCMTRCSTYGSIGVATSKSDPEYDLVKNWDKDSASSTPYLIKTYSQAASNKYYAKDISYSDWGSTITLNSSEVADVVYYLPDGYKGIGNLSIHLKQPKSSCNIEQKGV